MQTNIIEPYGIDMYGSRSKATNAYQSQIVPFWRDFSTVMRSQYGVEGTPVNWNAISGGDCPPVDSDAINPGGTRTWDTGLTETFVMTPIPGDNTFKVYIKVIYRISAFLYTDEQASYPRRANGVINFKIGTSLANIDKADRIFQIQNPVVGYRSGVAFLTRKFYITAEKGFFGITYASMNYPEAEYHSSMYLSYMGDPLTNTARKELVVAVNSVGNSSDIWYRVGGSGNNGKFFSDSENGTANVTYVVSEDESNHSLAYNSYLVNPDQVPTAVTNPSGTETILIGPYFSNNAKVWTNVFPATPFLVMPKAAGASGSETIINGWKYRATNIIADSGTNYFQQTRTWVRVGDAPTSG